LLVGGFHYPARRNETLKEEKSFQLTNMRKPEKIDHRSFKVVFSGGVELKPQSKLNFSRVKRFSQQYIFGQNQLKSSSRSFALFHYFLFIVPHKTTDEGFLTLILSFFLNETSTKSFNSFFSVFFEAPQTFFNAIKMMFC
jgi:hypothetical protein